MVEHLIEGLRKAGLEIADTQGAIPAKSEVKSDAKTGSLDDDGRWRRILLCVVCESSGVSI
jgi:hypothetical protein